MDSELTDATFSILTVCTGNLVRSPLAAQLLRARLEAVAGVVSVSSAGTGATDGERMPAEAEHLSVAYGGDPSQHRARPVTEEMMSGAQLVLTATREQRAVVVSLFPRAARFTFTLNQFARLVDSVDAETLARVRSSATGSQALVELTAAAAAQRGYLPPLDDPAADDIEDPYLQSQAVYDRAGASVDAAVTTISRVLLSIVSLAPGPHGG